MLKLNILKGTTIKGVKVVVFRLSKKGEYALRSVFHLAVRDTICTTEEISKAQDIPRPFLKKIIQSLSVAGIVISTKGQKGGVVLALPSNKITPKDVIEKVEGPLFLNDCLLCEGTCPRDSICPLHEVWKKCQGKIVEELSASNFAELGKRHLELVAAAKKDKRKMGVIPKSILGLVPANAEG